MIRPASTLYRPAEASESRVRTLRLALAGCGVVGGAFLELLESEAEHFEKQHHLRLELTRVLVRDVDRSRPVPLEHALLTSDVSDFLATDADIVVEVVGGVELPYRIVKTALERGARVVTANKALLASAGEELALSAHHHGATLDFEAAVAAGIPIIRALRTSIAGQAVRAIRGILNGTTNYILNEVERGSPYEAALRKAQQLGFAEADPTRDLDATDARDKLCVLAWLAWGITPGGLAVRQRGIVSGTDRLVQDAAAIGGAVRLIADCVRNGNRLSASVEPVIVGRDSEAGRVVGPDNFVRVDFDDVPPLHFTGPGAGGAPTARAVLADVLQACPPVPRASMELTAEADAEDHRWLLSAPATYAQAPAALAEHGIAADPVDRSRDSSRFVVGPCPWPTLARALREVAPADQLSVARLEIEV